MLKLDWYVAKVVFVFTVLVGLSGPMHCADFLAPDAAFKSPDAILGEPRFLMGEMKYDETFKKNVETYGRMIGFQKAEEFKEFLTRLRQSRSR